MSDFLKEIQFDILETARGSFGQTWTVEELRPSLKELRESYSLKTGPDFSNPMIRLAYSLASHPYHALMSYEMFSQCAHVLKARRVTEFSATLLGAGPGAEAIALVRLLAAKMPDLECGTYYLPPPPPTPPPPQLQTSTPTRADGDLRGKHAKQSCGYARTHAKMCSLKPSNS